MRQPVTDRPTASRWLPFTLLRCPAPLRFLHSEALLAVAQNRWLHIYDNQGIELHCVRRCDRVTRLEFLPFHFLLATAVSDCRVQGLDGSPEKTDPPLGPQKAEDRGQSGLLPSLSHSQRQGF